MIGIVATIKIKEGSEKDFVSVAKELVAAVHANEPGCILYALHKTDDPQTFVMMERYTDETAVATHRASDHFKKIGARMGPFMTGRPDVLMLTEV